MKNQKLSYAIMAILGAHATAVAAAPAEGEKAASGEIADIVVTAQRRSESIQTVPITIQALTAETLTQLNVTTFEDYAKFLPNVTAASNGPGQGQIYMRGLATTEDGLQSSGATGSFPNVAVYVDDQSAQLPGRNLDIYAADMERIEVLEGPQGTLFGAGAQAGVVRYITNKPKLNITEGNVHGGYATTAHGNNSNNFDAMLNLPLIQDKLAIRGVVYNDSRGGYINNVPGTFTRNPTDVGIAYFFCPQTGATPGSPGYAPYLHGAGNCLGGDGRTVLAAGVVPPGSATINNNNIVGRAINPVVYKGIRVTGLYQFDDDWSALVTQSYQDMRADGVFSDMPYGPDGKALPDLSVVQFNPSWNKDSFTNTAWTLNGRIAMLKMVYTGGYLVRNVEQVQDYTNYARGKYADYYQCRLPGGSFTGYSAALSAYAKANPADPGQCYSPSSTFHVIERNVHQNHELRLSTPDEWNVRGIFGLFWEDFKVQDQSDWLYKTTPFGPDALYGATFVNLGAPAGSSVNNPNPRSDSDAFYDDVQRGFKQRAGFLSVDVDIIPKTLTFTAGTRYYNMDTYEVGAKASSYGCRPGGIYSAAAVTYPCLNYGIANLDTITVPAGNSAYSDKSQGLEKTYKGFKSRANLSWKVAQDVLVYGTWSQGFRPGGFNRGSGFVGGSSPLAGSFLVPIGFKPDVLTNTELGWKTQWFNRRLQFNGAIYQEKWNDVQIGIFDPGVTGNLTFTTNGPNYTVKGLETELIARIAPSLTVSGSASWNRSELTNTPTLFDKNGNPVTSVTPYGKVGSPLAQSPPFQANLRIRYEFTLNDYDAFLQLAGTHRAHSFASTDQLSHELSTTPGQVGPSIAYEQAPFSTLDASLGVAKDAWLVQLYAQNLTDTRAELYTNYNEWIRMTTINRPRTIGLHFGYKFSGR